MTSPSDRELLSGATGDGLDERAAFAEFARRYWGMVWRVALRATGDPELAAEAAQDAFVLAWRNRNQFPEGARITTWLHVFVMNAARETLWRARSERALLVGDLPDVSAPDIIAQVETKIDVGDLLSRLPVEQRAALLLIAHGYTYDEAAAELKISAERLKAQVWRARSSLAQFLPRPESVDRGSRPAESRVSASWYFGPEETEPPFPETAMTTLYEGLDRLFTKLGPPSDELLRDGSHG